jgi:hypothetical protein
MVVEETDEFSNECEITTPELREQEKPNADTIADQGEMSPPEMPWASRPSDLSETIPKAEDGFNQKGEVLARPIPPYSLHDFEKFRARLLAGEASIEEFKAEFSWLKCGKDLFISHLIKNSNAAELKHLAGRFGCYFARTNTKLKNAQAIYRGVLQSFALGESIRYELFAGETFETAIANIAHSVTEEKLRAFACEQKQKESEDAKAFTNPETLPEFRRFVSVKGEGKLSDEELSRYDTLAADESRALRNAKTKTIVARVEAPTHLALIVTQSFHEKRNCPVWVVKLSSRVERGTLMN